MVAASGYWVNSNMAAPETHRATYLIAFIGDLDVDGMSTTARVFAFMIPSASEARIFAIAGEVGALALIDFRHGSMFGAIHNNGQTV